MTILRLPPAPKIQPNHTFFGPSPNVYVYEHQYAHAQMMQTSFVSNRIFSQTWVVEIFGLFIRSNISDILTTSMWSTPRSLTIMAESLENKRRTLNVFSDWGGMFGFVLHYEIQKKHLHPYGWLLSTAGITWVECWKICPGNVSFTDHGLPNSPLFAETETLILLHWSTIKPTRNTWCKNSAKEVGIITISKDTKLKQTRQYQSYMQDLTNAMYFNISVVMMLWSKSELQQFVSL